MHVCFVLDENLYRPAGVQYYILGIADKLIDDGHQVTVIHTANSSVDNHTINPAIKIHDIAKGFDIPIFSPNGGVSVIPGIASKKAVDQILESNVFDVMHFNYPYSPLVSGTILHRLKKQELITGRHAKKVATFHVYVEEYKIKILMNKVLAFLNKQNVKMIDNFINTGVPTEFYGKKYLNRDSSYIPIGIENDEKSLIKTTGNYEVLFLGRLQKRKGILEFLNMLALVKKSLLKNITITVAGDGPERKKAEYKAKRLGLNIDFVGTVHSEKDELYARADIAIFPTRYGETFGIVLLEAMNNHAVVIGYANAGYKSTMKELSHEYLVESENQEQLADLLSKLLSLNRKELESHQKKQKTFIKKNYDIDKIYALLHKIYFSK